MLDALAAACGHVLLDLHADPDHNRCVLTLGGTGAEVTSAVRELARTAVERIDLSQHSGRHPRIGVVDVVPFVPLVLPPAMPAEAPTPAAVASRDRFAEWASADLGLPCFLYGPLPGGRQRSLPEIRRAAFRGLGPDAGPALPHPTAGAAAVGARGVLVAYNVWVASGDVQLARTVAAKVRGPSVRALGLDLAGRPQISCNLVRPLDVGPAEAHDSIAALLDEAGAGVERCELVGLVPQALLDRVPQRRWQELGLAAESTIEARLAERSIS